jgi:glucose/arabinose dehydrogenase
VKILSHSILGLLVAATASAQAGIDVREPNTELVITEIPPDLPAPISMEAIRVFPQLSFSQAVLLVELVDPDDASARLFHVSQSGVIHVFPNIPDPSPADVSVFLDISDQVLNAGEQGLLGLAFDPDFFDNGEFYVYYSASPPRRSVISRFTVPAPQTGAADPASEEVILEVAQPFSNHNGGMIAFGPDDMFYIALGDGGGGGDPQGHGQNRKTLLGSILRIDVRSAPVPGSGINYVIPAANPFTASPPRKRFRHEIYAYGFRNPYRFSFDRLTGELYAADVGQNRWEEIDVVRSGGNYGWRVMEGNHCFKPGSKCGPSRFVRPIGEYSHHSNGAGGGASVTGGYVYYGSEMPELYGAYVFADFVSGRVMALRYDGAKATPIVTLASTSLNPSGFGQDSTGEVYLLDYFGGIYVMRPVGAPMTSSFPTRLSDLPALLAAGSGQGHTVAGVFPYEPEAKSWSDHSVTESYLALPDYDYPAPDYASIGYREAGAWGLPDDTVIVQNILLPLDLGDPVGSLKRIETRLLYRYQGEWYPFSFAWDDDEMDAVRLPASMERHFTILDGGGQAVSYTWKYPNQNDCRRCHTTGSETPGLVTAQMNHDFLYPSSGVTDNQLATYEWLSLFDPSLPAVPDDLPRMPDPADAGASLQDRARAYLAANCSTCHQLGGTAGTNLDLRWEVENSAMNAIGVKPRRGRLGIGLARIVKPGDPNRSILLQRMITSNPQHWMPPLGSRLVDDDSVALIRDWILSLPH